MLRATWLPAAILVLMFSGCSRPSSSLDQSAQVASRSFSDDDRRAARSLSIGNVGALESLTSPFEQALLCSLALEEMIGRVGESGIAIPDAQKKVLDQARRIYERRASEGAQEAEAGLQEARQRIKDRYPEPAQRAQISVGCLQKLAQG